MSPRARDIEERLMEKVDKSGECWVWIAAAKVRGYGQIKWNGRMRLAHRVSYELAKGPIPEGMVIDHMCHNVACINPGHLRAATHKQNMENLAGERTSNKSGARGVTWHKGRRKWEVSVSHNGRTIYGGLYLSVDDAKEAAIELRNKLFTHNDADRKAA